MTPFLAELTGTALLIVLGDGVVANVVLARTKGNGGGLIAITFGWAIAVFVGVYTTASVSGAHLNPAVSFAMAALGRISWSTALLYMLAQLTGAMLGAGLVWLVYRPHFDATKDADLKLAVFCTSPAIPNHWNNLISEIAGTCVLIIGVLYITGAAHSLGSLDALPVALLVLGIGLSLGGTTGYAINPARDLGPRIMHAILPISGKGRSEWQYSWIPVMGPILGAALACLIYAGLQG
ncbi:MAG TPA: MIP/aquaporin family protein [Sediminibacterium sp.]|nr:MIP/aquaporin family protein [Sediminibacterium sp.]